VAGIGMPQTPLARQIGTNSILLVGRQFPTVNQNLGDQAREIGLEVGREATNMNVLGPTLREYPSHLPRPPCPHAGHAATEADLVVKRLTVTCGEEPRIMIDFGGRLRIAEDDENRHGRFLMRQIGQQQARARLRAKLERRFAMQAASHEQRPMIGRRLIGIAAISALVSPPGDTPQRWGW